MKRILVIGRSGAGKTTFADILGKTLNREVIHLDNLFWKPGWVRAFNSEKWEKVVQDLIQKDEWILDGNYHNTLEMRLQRADTVVFFDTSPFRALLNGLKRKLFPSKETADKVPRLHSEVSLWILAKSIYKFPSKRVREQIKKANIKDVYFIKNQKDANKLMQSFVQTQNRKD